MSYHQLNVEERTLVALRADLDLLERPEGVTGVKGVAQLIYPQLGSP